MSEEHYIYGGNAYCFGCLPVPTHHPEVDDGSGAQDSPAHCVCCSIPLAYVLTAVGVQYVIDELLDMLDRWPARGMEIIDEIGSYYHGCRHIEITRDWANDLRDYSLDAKDKFIVNQFLAITDGSVPLPRMPVFKRSRRAFDWLAMAEGR